MCQITKEKKYCGNLSCNKFCKQPRLNIKEGYKKLRNFYLIFFNPGQQSWKTKAGPVSTIVIFPVKKKQKWNLMDR